MEISETLLLDVEKFMEKMGVNTKQGFYILYKERSKIKQGKFAKGQILVSKEFKGLGEAIKSPLKDG